MVSIPELGTAWLTIAISADNMQRDIRRELQKIDDGTAKTVGRKLGKDLSSEVGLGAQNAAGEVKTRLSERLGSQVGSVVGKGIGAGLKLGIAGAASAAALAVGGVGIALKKGFDRLESIDQARTKLQALGHSSGETAKIMDNALASVNGTAFGLADAATAAASAVAAGIKPGEDLTKYLTEVANAAAFAGTNFDDMGSIFNKIQTSNKAYTDDLQQLSDKGIPIFQWLQNEYGVTADKLSDMVQKGEVDSAHFQDAIDKNMGGVAVKMGQTFDGAVDNMEASVARLGANLITALLGGDPSGDTLAGPKEAIEGLTRKFDEIGKWVQEHGPQIHKFFADMVNDIKPIGERLGQVAGFLGDHPRLIEAAVGAFALFKTVSGVSALASSLGSIASGLDGLPGKAKFSAGGISSALAAIAIPAALYEILNGAAQDKIQQWDDAYWKRRDEDNRRQDLGLKPRQPGVGDPGGPPAVGQGNLPSRPAAPPVQSQLRQRIAAGQLPGFSINSGGVIVGADGKPAQLPPGFGGGGGISGPGGPTSDSIPALLSNGEHVWTADEVNKVGGQGAMYALRRMVRGFAGGGAITIDGLKQFASGVSGHGYVWGGGNGASFDTDCSGAQATIANFITGGQGRFSTAGEGSALLSRGFQTGDPPPGVTAYWVGWRNGGPGGGHTAGTIVDPKNGNVNVEMGGSSGGGSYGSNTGAASFPNRAWIAVAGGDDPSKNDFAGSSGGSSGGSSLPSSGAGGGADASSIASTAFSAFQQTAGLDGSVLSDPTQWPNVKSGLALMNFFTGLGQAKGDLGSNSINIGGLNIPFGAKNPLAATTPLADSPHAGSGAPPGPTFNVTANGMDPKAVVDKQAHAYNQQWRKNMSAVKPGL